MQAQRNKQNSLLSLLASARDTNRVNILNQLSSSYWYSDLEKTFEFGRQADSLASQLHFIKGRASAYNNIGVGYYQQNKYPEALQWYEKAIAAHKQAGNFR